METAMAHDDRFGGSGQDCEGGARVGEGGRG